MFLIFMVLLCGPNAVWKDSQFHVVTPMPRMSICWVDGDDCVLFISIIWNFRAIEFIL